MKKINIFLIIIVAVLSFTNNINVKAESTTFYEAETIPGVYLNKEKAGITYYLTGKIVRENHSNQHAYCIEPFVMFNANSVYTPTFNPNNLTIEQQNKIALISHFGYGYQNHTDSKWYAITQLMIWQVADPNADYYFTQTLNGQRIEPFNNEINEINNLINNYTTKNNIDGKTYYSAANNLVNISYSGLSEYTVTSNNATISKDTITINPISSGIETITLTKNKPAYNKPIIYYQSNTSQTLMTVGDIPAINISFNVAVKNTEIKITKIDKDTNSITPSGEASLIGSVYQVYDNQMNELYQVTIDENNQTIINDIQYAKYYIKEIKAGIGYTLNETIYEVFPRQDNTNIELTVENKVIEKEITLKKYYGTTNNFIPEENISFEIYNNKNTLVETITTNNLGIATANLPYGTYTVKQLNTTAGYKETDDFKIIIEDNNPETIELYDYKIPVPDTNTTKKSTISLISLIICIGICYVKKNNPNLSNNY